MSCPYCGGENLKKNGILKSGIQRYYCKDCNKYFNSDTILIEKEENPKCIYCGGHTNKSGKTKWGVQIYWCRECHKRFNENTMPQPPIKERCPYCGGELKYKGWSNNGHARRYLCKECGKGFSGDLSKLKKHVIEMPCPYCGSEDIKKGGHLKSGARRYVCNSCGKGYNENTIVKDPPHKPDKCPKCGGTHINLCGHEKSGKQRYKCIDCKHRFVENPVQQTFKTWKKECPRCGHKKARKAGKSSGKQYYQCLKCNHKYLEGGMFRHTTTKDKNEIVQMFEDKIPQYKIANVMKVSQRTIHNILKVKGLIVDTSKTPKGELREEIKKLILSGHSIQKLAKEYGYSCDTLQGIVRYDYMHETLSKQQENLIVKFGVGLSVPVNDLAPYIPCSIKKCKQVLSKYNIPKKKKYVRTEQEKHQDDLVLDRFLGV